MGLWDKVKDWFTKEEEYEFDEERKAREEKKLFDDLFELERESRKQEERRKQDKHDAAMPIEPNYDYVEVDDTTDQEIKDAINGKYSEEDKLAKEKIESDYANKKEQEALKKQEIDAKAREKEEKLAGEKAKEEEGFKNKAIKSGIIDSSIVSSNSEELEKLEGSALEMLEKSKNEAISKIDGELEYLDELQKQAKANHDNSMSSKINGEIEKLTDKRDSLVEKQKLQNKNNDNKKNLYEQNRQKAEEKFKDTWDADVARRNESEARYGYQGENKSNYDKRLELATAYFKQYPKEVALQLFDANTDVQKLLGRDAYKLRYALSDGK